MKLFKLSKLVLCALAVSATSVWAGSQSWNLSNSGYGPNNKNQTNYFMTTGYTQFTASVSGYGYANGVAHVHNGTLGQAVCDATAGSGGGAHFGDYDSGYASSGSQIVIFQLANLSDAGYSSVASTVTATW